MPYLLVKPFGQWKLWWWSQKLEETNVMFNWSPCMARLAHSASPKKPHCLLPRMYRTCELCRKSWQASREGLTRLRNSASSLLEPVKSPHFCWAQWRAVDCGRLCQGLEHMEKNEISSSATVVLSSVYHIYQGNQIWQLKCLRQL